ncbi:MAG: ATP-binding protein [Planctomycetota bacterium]|nr:ATP-binding protein [Planctomycetota bacterium]
MSADSKTPNSKTSSRTASKTPTSNTLANNTLANNTLAKNTPAKNNAEHLLLKSNLKQLRLPTMKAEFEQLARDAADSNQPYEQYLLQLTELEVAARAANTLNSRIKQAQFPVAKDRLKLLSFIEVGRGS